MKKRVWILQIWGGVIGLFVTAMVLTAATYAWFTSNRIVTTDTATARSGTAELELEISTQGGGSFRNVEEATIMQVNQTTKLMPVSTADLRNFVTNRATVSNAASGNQEARDFAAVSGETDYYHGRIYLRATATDSINGKMALYLDQDREAGGSLAGAVTGTTAENLLNAGRLGLVISRGSSDAGSVIFRLSDASNRQPRSNTRLNGTLLGADQVLSSNASGRVSAVKDPAVSLESYAIRMDDDQIRLPDRPLAHLELNQIYQVDVYFYLEGCDSDCTDDISNSMADLHLAFYGVLEQ